MKKKQGTISADITDILNDMARKAGHDPEDIRVKRAKVSGGELWIQFEQE